MAKRSTFAWSPLRRLMKNAGAVIVSREAVKALMNALEQHAKALTESALKFAKHSKRKKISQADFQLAIDMTPLKVRYD